MYRWGREAYAEVLEGSGGTAGFLGWVGRLTRMSGRGREAHPRSVRRQKALPEVR